MDAILNAVPFGDMGSLVAGSMKFSIVVNDAMVYTINRTWVSFPYTGFRSIV